MMEAMRRSLGRLGALVAVVLATMAPIQGLARPPDRPIVFLPGILGSVLVDRRGEIVWGDVGSLGRFGNLRIPDGPGEPDDGVRPKEILRSIPLVFGLFSVKQYETFEAELRSLGYGRDQPYFPYAYDWRRSAFKVAEDFARFVEREPALRDGAFDILGHSLGGLVAQVYVKQIDRGARVRRLITMGTPFRGSLNTVGTLSEGWGAPWNWIAGGLATIRQTALSFPAFYELLPRYPNCCVLGLRSMPRSQTCAPGRRCLVDLLAPTDWAQLDWFAGGGTAPAAPKVAAALADASRLRDLADVPWPAGVELYQFAGEGMETRNQLYIDPATRAVGELLPTNDGDGTVPLFSAANLQVGRSFVSFAPHQTIFADPTFNAQLRRILIEPGPPSGFNATVLSALSVRNEVVLLQAAGLDVAPKVVRRGEAFRGTLRLVGGRGTPVETVRVAAEVVGPDGRTTPVRVDVSPPKDEGADVTRAAFMTEAVATVEAGPYTLRFDVGGLGRVEDYVAAVPEG